MSGERLGELAESLLMAAACGAVATVDLPLAVALMSVWVWIQAGQNEAERIASRLGVASELAQRELVEV